MELNYWKEAALMNLDENDANKLKDSTPPSLLLTRTVRNNAREVNIDEIIYYLRSQYSSDDENRVCVVKIYSAIYSVERMLKEVKAIPKQVKETEYVSPNNSFVFGEWLSNVRSRYKYIKNNDLLQQFDKSVE